MGSASESPARQRLRIELWSWSAWLILAIVSYPALLLIWAAPRAGLLAGLVAGLLVAYTASLGYSGRRDLERWFAAVALSTAASVVISVVALLGDRVTASSAVLCGLIVMAETMFAWNFLPWLVRDADSSEAAVPPGRPLPMPPRASPHAVRPALGLVLMLALLALGLGSAWSKGEAHVPNPTAWVVAVGALCLAFMFVERIASFERAAREGNLLMAPGSYRSWLRVALAVLLIAAALATALPRQHAKADSEASRGGNAPVASAAQSAGEKLGAVTESLAAAARASGAHLPSPIRASNSAPLLLLLLLVLLLALMLIWVFRRSRAARWLTRAMTALLAAVARLWRRLRDFLIGTHRAQAATSPAQMEGADPLRDIFAQPDRLANLTAREIAILTYHLLLNFAEMLGHGRRRGQTPFEYARALEQEAPSAAESVRALTWAYSGAMYGGESASLPDPSSVRDSWERLSSALVGEMTEEELTLRRRAYLAGRRVERKRE